MDWVEYEVRHRVAYTMKRAHFTIVNSTIFLAVSVYLLSMSWPTLGLGVGIIMLLFSVKLMKSDSLDTKKWGVFMHYEGSQTIVHLASSYLLPGISAILCIASTLVLAISEVSPLYPRLLNTALVVKHLAVWICIMAQNYEITLWPFGLIPYFWAIVHVLLYISSKESTLATLASYSEALHLEERLLDSLLQAVPDGIAVIGGDLQVLAFNRSLLTQLDLTRSATAADCQAVLSELIYAESYSQQGNPYLAADLRVFVRKETGEVLSFAPVERAGCFLECRGVVTQWWEQQVCVLTVRDTSKWVELEGKAQLENQRKTAMLRSVCMNSARLATLF